MKRYRFYVVDRRDRVTTVDQICILSIPGPRIFSNLPMAVIWPVTTDTWLQHSHGYGLINAGHVTQIMQENLPMNRIRSRSFP